MTPSSETYSITISSRIASAGLHAGRCVGRIERGCNGLPSPSHSTCACARGVPPYARAPATMPRLHPVVHGFVPERIRRVPALFSSSASSRSLRPRLSHVPPIRRSLPRALRGDGSVGAGEELGERRRENVGRHLA